MTSVFLASDHRGFELKSQLKTALPSLNLPYDFIDLGPQVFNPTDDFNDGAIAVARKLQTTPNSFGILICGSGVGMEIQANRFKTIRAARLDTPEEVKTAREHNHLNILCLSANLFVPKPPQAAPKPSRTTPQPPQTAPESPQTVPNPDFSTINPPKMPGNPSNLASALTLVKTFLTTESLNDARFLRRINRLDEEI